MQPGAITLDEPRYRTCKRCRRKKLVVGIDISNLGRPICKRCQAEKRGIRARRYYRNAKNSTKFKEKRNEKNRRWRANNPDASYAATKKWRAKNPEKVKQYCVDRRKRIRQDPERYQEYLENKRISEKLWRERNGSKIRVVSLEQWKQMNGRVKRSERLPIDPLIEFLKSTHLNNNEIAAICEVDEAVIRRIMNKETETKEISMVDHICYSMGMPTAVVYGDDFAVDCTQAS